MCKKSLINGIWRPSAVNLKAKLYLLTILISLLPYKVLADNDTAIKVVTSFTILQNLVEELGGTKVEIINLVAANSDAHIYSPKPSDAVAIANADLVVMNGLGFEGWMSRLIENNATPGKKLVASRGINPLFIDGEADPHAWQSFKNIKQYIFNITQALIDIKPQYRIEFTQLNQAYMQSLNRLNTELAQQLNSIPEAQRVVVTSHDAFNYLGDEFNISFIAPAGINTDIEPSASDVAKLIGQIKAQNIKALFVENISNPRLLEQIGTETNVAIGGSLYSDALTDIHGPAATYLDMMKYNIESLVEAFKTQ